MKREFTIQLPEEMESQAALRLLRRRFVAVWEPEEVDLTKWELTITRPWCVPTRKHERPRSRMWYWLMLREMRMEAADGELRVHATFGAVDEPADALVECV